MSLSTIPLPPEEDDTEVKELSHHRRREEAPDNTSDVNHNASSSSLTALDAAPKKPSKIGGRVKKAAKATNHQVKKGVKKATRQVKRAKKFAGDLLTNSRLFNRLVDSIFARCQLHKDGLVSQEELYSAILLIHLKLAKHVGPAACSPPKRKTIIRLFNASDLTDTGYIDREEFNTIAKMCCTQIMGRIAAYWCCMVFVAPLLAYISCDYYDLPEGSLRERAMEKVLSFGLMAIILPFLWEIVDARMERAALIKKEEISGMDEVIYEQDFSEKLHED